MTVEYNRKQDGISSFYVVKTVRISERNVMYKLREISKEMKRSSLEKEEASQKEGTPYAIFFT